MKYFVGRAWRGFRDLAASAAPGSERSRGDGDEVTSIAACRDRQRRVVQGTLSRVTAGTSGHRSVEALLGDGSDALHLVWMGRRAIPGIVEGRQLRAQGRVSVHGGRKVMYNPHYELIS